MNDLSARGLFSVHQVVNAISDTSTPWLNLLYIWMWWNTDSLLTKEAVNSW